MLERLQKMMEGYLVKNHKPITEESVLMMDLGLNSFDLVQLACQIEDEMDIEIPDEVLMRFKTVGDVIAYLNANSQKI